MAPDDPPSTEERIDRLEQAVREQNETIREMLPSRRGVLAGAGLLGAGALAGAGSQSGSAQAAAGQVGTPSSPEDVFAAAVDAQEVSTDKASIKSASDVNPRQFVTSLDGTGTIDLSTISEWRSEYQTVIFEGLVKSTTGGTSSWWVRVNNLTTTDAYTTVSRTGATLSETLDDKWVVAAQSSGIRAVPVRLHISGENDLDRAGRVTANVGHDNNALVFGDADVSDDVNQIEFGSTDTGLKYTGAVYLAGPS